MTEIIKVNAPLAERRDMEEAGRAADHYASQQVFSDYQDRKSANTLRAQLSDLATFAEYLREAGISECPTAKDLQTIPTAWHGVSFGLVDGFRKWLAVKGFTLTSLNRKLSTVKVYAGLAAKASVITGDSLSLIMTVKGYAAKEFTKVNEKRTQKRQSTKKEKSTSISRPQAKALKQQPDTPQGRRDAVIMTLLLDHGLRVGELVNLDVTNIDLASKTLKFFRSKVQKTQTHALSTDAYKALKAYSDAGDIPAMGKLLRRSFKAGRLGDSGMTELGVNLRVAQLGDEIGLAGLGPHDCRHYWATRAIKNKTDPFSLMQAGGWTSMQTVQKYVSESEIANAGVMSDKEEDEE